MRAAFLALLAVLSASCGGAAPAPVARKAPPPRPAPAASCHAIVAHATALFTDAPAEERARLDTAMAKGLAVVAYDAQAASPSAPDHPLSRAHRAVGGDVKNINSS